MRVPVRGVRSARLHGVAIVLFSGVAVVTLFVLRGRGRHAPSVRGAPATPALYVVVSVLILISDLVSKPLPTCAGLLVMGRRVRSIGGSVGGGRSEPAPVW